MPPDTTYIPGQTGPPPPTGNQFVDSILQSTWQVEQISAADDRPQYIMPEWAMFLVVLVIVYFLLVRPVLNDIREQRKKYYHVRKTPLIHDEMNRDHWLNRYNPYYASLTPEEKKRFLHRVHRFMASKQFRFHSMVEEAYIPVLISGTAVQLTFGLRNYLMDYFEVIHVMRREYVLNIDKETYYGHVSKSGIHISWSHFMEGYHDYSDSINVGLHEMAHAIQYDSVLGDEDVHDRNFKQRLQEFAQEGRPVFRAMRQGASHLLDDYAANNFDEFWAVSVETFFENPEEFKEKLPNLYEEMTQLLNQDPLGTEKVLSKQLS